MRLKPRDALFVIVEMKTIMKLEDLRTIEQLTDFLSDIHALAFW